MKIEVFLVLLFMRQFRVFCLDSATLRSPFLRSIKKGVIRRIFAESTLNLLLNEPFLAKNAILENTKSFGKG